MRKRSPYRRGAASDAEQVRTALLLAAGVGARLAPLTYALPKCLVPVNGMPIVGRLLRALDAHRIERLLIVDLATRRDDPCLHRGDRFGGIAVEYVVNPEFATTNTLYSLWLARSLVDEPLLLFESDIVFDEPLLAPLLRPDRIAVSRQLPWINGPTVTLDANCMVSAYYQQPPGVYSTAPMRTISWRSTSPVSHERRGPRFKSDSTCTVRKGHTGCFHDVVFAEMTAAGTMALTGRDHVPADRWYRSSTPADRDAAELCSQGGGAPGGVQRLRGSVGAEWRVETRRLTVAARARVADALDRERPANLCSLAALLAATLGIYFAVRGAYPAAMIALLWAVVLDWSDGRLARAVKGRGADQRALGAQLDSLVDVIGFCVAPALLLLFVGHLSPWFVPGAFVVLSAGVIRLSYFNVYGLLGASYRGLSLDNNIYVLALLFVFEPLVSTAIFAAILYVVLMVLAALNVASIATPKLSGRWYYVVILFALALSGVYGLEMW